MSLPIRSGFVKLLFAAALLAWAPGAAFGQFEGLRWVGVPPVGSTVEFEDYMQISSIKEVRKLRVSNVREETAGDVDYVWIEVESEIYDPKLAEDRVPVISRFALPKEELRKGERFMEVLGDLVIQIADRPPFRIPQSLKGEMVRKGYLSGGLAGAGSFVGWEFEDAGEEDLEVPAGSFKCRHKFGRGKVNMFFEGAADEAVPIDAWLDIWLSEKVPFGIVKMALRMKGEGPSTETVTNLVIAMQTFTLQSYGTGYKTKIVPRKQKEEGQKETEEKTGEN